MRIALLADAAALHTRRWARALAARGVTTRLFSLEALGDDGEDGGPALDAVKLKVWPLPRAMRYPLARFPLAAALAEFAPDLVEAHFVPNYGVLGALAGRRPLVVHAWGSDLLCSPKFSPLHAARARWALHAADLVVVDADVLADVARSLGVPEGRLLVAPWGADLERFPLAAPVLAPHVVSLRQLEPVYDVACLLEALPAVRAAVPDVTLTVAGDGALRGALEAQSRALGVADRVRFVGRVPHAALPELLAAAAVAVSCARSDSTSISLLEAMASGATPVVTDLPGNRAWVSDGVEGHLFPPGDATALAAALIATLRDGVFRARARVLARRRVEEHGGFGHAVDGVLARYRTLLARGVAA